MGGPWTWVARQHEPRESGTLGPGSDSMGGETIDMWQRNQTPRAATSDEGNMSQTNIRVCPAPPPLFGLLSFVRSHFARSFVVNVEERESSPFSGSTC